MIDTFLTSYDPSDLPGSSIDPLGFEKGYLFLADKILPGMTNVASKPRYFPLLCAGILLERETGDRPVQAVLAARRDSILRLERFWALANVLARGPEGSGNVRGVSYARQVAARLIDSKATSTDARYELLKRQIQYGGIGMYGVVADGMRFLNRDTLSLTPDLGEPIAEAFLEETQMPAVVKKGVRDDCQVGISTLRDWGERAHVDGSVGSIEGRLIGQALLSHPVRSRMAALLGRNPAKEGVTELLRLGKIGSLLKPGDADTDLAEAIRCIIAYESAYRWSALAFERLLWVCKQHAAASISFQILERDSVIQAVQKKLPAAATVLIEILDNPTTDEFLRDLNKLDDVARFVRASAEVATNTEAFIRNIIDRHSGIQAGKVDGGRKKMPWLEINGDSITLKATRVGGLRFEATTPEDILPHPYRLAAADAMLRAAKAAST